MSSRSSSSSTFASSTSSFSTTTTSTSLYSTSRSSPPPRYSAHFTHLSPYATPVDTSKSLPPSPSHHQEQQNPRDLHQQQQSPRWTPLSSHGLPRSPVPGQVLHRSRTRRPRASSVSELPATITTSEPTDTGSMGASDECENGRAPRSQSRPAARNPYAQQTYTPGHRQTQSLGQPQHYEHHHDYQHNHCHSSTAATAERHRQEDARATNDAAAASGSREPLGSTSKLKQFRTKVATSCAGWRERERERRRLATEDVVEVGRGGHWSEY
ncbi:uncharacterized protein J3D65DRAFT_601621 [Phyllosticta citribraziliensis]|uniref:Uncharacterized protein n=1 Tax=Phyllosticta citribraziliensis TaxID=989973 RepID=A0ABR1LWJ3_9PEZI